MGKRAVTVAVVGSETRWRAYSPRSRWGLPDGKRDTRMIETIPDREEPGVARADAGESLRLTSYVQSAKRASCSKIPRRRACHRR